MIKRTLYFGNPAYLSLRLGQLLVRLPEVEHANVSESFKKEAIASIPIEDIGVVVLDHPQVTITQALMEALLEQECALVSCDAKHLPVGLFLPLCGNSCQTERFREQIAASLPLQKQLWQQTVTAKINNQAAVLSTMRGCVVKNMQVWASEVRSGDPDNLEARSAAYYWKEVFPEIADFRRDREGVAPNQWLNYGYALLRAVAARALVSSGLLPTFGMHHRNKYNAYCLADDVMEPYRPYVDRLVMQMAAFMPLSEPLTQEVKVALLKIPAMDVRIAGRNSPLMVAMSQTTASLQRCYSGESRRIIYPEISM